MVKLFSLTPTEFLQKVLLAMFFIFIIGKIMAVILQDVFKRFAQNKEKNEQDFDKLVNKKKNELSFNLAHQNTGHEQGASSTAEIPPPLPSHLKSTETLSSYREFFSKASKESSPNLADIKKCLDILGQIEWGDGPYYLEVQKRVLAKTPKLGLTVSLNAQKIHQIFKTLVKKNVLLRKQGHDLATSEEILNALSNLVLLGILAEQGSELQLKLLVSLQGKLFSQVALKSKNELQALLPKTIDEQITAWRDLLLSSGRKEFIDMNALLAKLDEKKLTFESIAPLTDVAEGDENGALKALGLSTNNPNMHSWESIKKRFKTLASTRHPDRFSTYKDNPEIIQTANKNFIILQKSYDILKNLHDKTIKDKKTKM